MIKPTLIAVTWLSLSSLAVAETGWYISGDVGTHQTDASAKLKKGSSSVIDSSMYEGVPSFDYDNDTVAGVTVGKALTSRVRVELEWRTRELASANQIQNGSGIRTSDRFQLDSAVQSQSFMLNGLFDLPSYGRWTPYLKAGIGSTRHKTDATLNATIQAFGINNLAPNAYPSKTSREFSWAVGTGAQWKLTPKTSFDIEYQYIDMGTAQTATDSFSDTIETELKGHELTTGLTYRF